MLVLTSHALDPVQRQHSRVSSQTGPHRRTVVLLRPRQNAFKAGPVGLLAQIRGERLAAGDDQPVRTLLRRLLPKLLNAKVKAAHAALAEGRPLHLGQSKERQVDQHVPRSGLEQPEKLKLGCAHGCIGHVVDQADPQKSAALLFESAFLDTRPVQAGRQLRIGILRIQKDWHGKLPVARRGERRCRLHCRVQGLIEVGQDVVYMFNPNAQADHFRQNTGASLLLGRHLPVCRRSRVAGQRLGVAQVHQPGNELERIVEADGGCVAPLDAQCQQRAALPAQVLLRQCMVRTVGKAGVLDPGHARVAAQEFGHFAAVLHVALDAQRRGLDSLQQQERAERREYGSHRALIPAAAAGDVGRSTVACSV